MGYLYILMTIVFTVYGQLIVKVRVGRYGQLPPGLFGKLVHVGLLLLDPLILSGLLSAFVASLFWMAAMTKFQISYAYPFMSLSFVLVLILSVVFLHEPLTAYKVVGLVFIAVGIVICSRAA